MMARIQNTLIICLITILSATTRASSQNNGYIDENGRYPQNLQNNNRRNTGQEIYPQPPPSSNNDQIHNAKEHIWRTQPQQISTPPPSSNNVQSVNPNKLWRTQTQTITTTPPPTQNFNYPVHQSSEKIPYTPARPAVAASVFDLSKKILTAVLATNEQNKYLIISPTSISSALSLALAGARGETFRQLLTTLQFPETHTMCEVHEQFGKLLRDLVATIEWRQKEVSEAPINAETNDDYDINADEDLDDEPREHKISVANALFVQHDFDITRNYKQAMQKVYRAGIYDVNYATDPAKAANFINR
jgi:Serpin (serine protease inhibitor)